MSGSVADSVLYCLIMTLRGIGNAIHGMYTFLSYVLLKTVECVASGALQRCKAESVPLQSRVSTSDILRCMQAGTSCPCGPESLRRQQGLPQGRHEQRHGPPVR